MRAKAFLFTVLIALVCAAPALAEAPPQAAVSLAGKEVLWLSSANGQTSSERAALVNERLERWLTDTGRAAEVRLDRRRGHPALMLGDELLLVVSDEDAQLNRTSAEELASTWAKRLEEGKTERQNALTTEKEKLDHAWALGRRIAALLGVVLAGAVAAWLSLWATARIASDPQRHGLALSGSAVGALGALVTLAIALGTVGAVLVQVPLPSSPALLLLVTLVGGGLIVFSAELLGNLAGGLVVALTSLYRKGDMVRIGAHAGQVAKVGLLFTRLETERHGMRLVPNSSVLKRGAALGAPRAPEKLCRGLRLAYTVPRELAEAIVIEAALRTQGIADDPMPECLVAQLEEEAIHYELHAHLRKGERPEAVSSRFHVHLLDVLGENGLAPGGHPLPRPSLRIGMAPLDPGF